MYIYYTNKNFKIKKKIYLLNWKFSVILRRKNVCYYFCWSRGSVTFVEKIQFFLRFFWVSVCLFPPKQEVPLVCKGQKNKSSWRWTQNVLICCFFFFQNVFVTFFSYFRKLFLVGQLYQYFLLVVTYNSQFQYIKMYVQKTVVTNSCRTKWIVPFQNFPNSRFIFNGFIKVTNPRHDFRTTFLLSVHLHFTVASSSFA